jgi:DNA replication protein DnaC
MTAVTTTDAHKLPALLNSLRLPTFRKHWQQVTERADHEGWSTAQALALLAEYELAERQTRRIHRNLKASRLPAGKTLATFDFAVVPEVSKARVDALAAGDWLANAGNLIAVGNSGSGKTHLVAAVGHALIEAGYKVLYASTTEMVQRLQAARRDLLLERELAKLDRFHLLILDDITYAQKDQAETSVLFELIARRYETRSLAIAANQPFSTWEQVFPDKAMTVAAIDRLVHHATILELNVDSYRRRAAANRQPQDVAQASSASDNLGDTQPDNRDINSEGGDQEQT